MRTVRRRIGAREAERLLAGRPTDSDHQRLARLLAAAAAPTPDKLAGGLPVLVAFAQEQRQASPKPALARTYRRLAFPIGRMTAVKATAGLAVVLVGGTALAAETGRLPGRVQRQAHDMFSSLGVPAPRAGNGQRGVGGVGDQAPHASPSAGTPGPDRAASLELCRAWDAAQKDPHGKAMAAEKLKAVIKAAGGVASVPAYCAEVLATDTQPQSPATPPTSRPHTDSTTDSHPGNGSGNGHSDGAGNGRATPTPHR
jgi:hypothetical protein